MIEFNGVQGEQVDVYLRVYTTYPPAAYDFYVQWMRSMDRTPISINALTMLRFSGRLDIILD